MAEAKSGQKSHTIGDTKTEETSPKISLSVESVIVGLGWNCAKGVDLDAAAVSLDAAKNIIDIVYFKDLHGVGINHAGDCRSGVKTGDDERIRIDFSNLPKNCVEIFILVNNFSDSTFEQV